MDLLQKIDTLTIQLAQREREREKDFAAVVKAGETTCDGVHDIATAVNRLVDGLAGAFGITLEPKEKKKEGGK